MKKFGFATTLFALCMVLMGIIAVHGKSAAPDSTFVLLDGSRLHTSDLRGKVALVNFWATSCTACVAAMPNMVRTFEKYRAQGFTTIAVAMQYDPPSYVVRFSNAHQLPFGVAIDNTGAIAMAWDEVRVTPTTYVVNKKGDIVRRIVGTPDFAELHALIEQLLGQA